jgi:hypothetical protein
MTISQIMAAVPTADADAPAFDHGDTESNPKPAPNASSVTDKAAATNAPATIAAQDTPDKWDSRFQDASA